MPSLTTTSGNGSTVARPRAADLREFLEEREHEFGKMLPAHIKPSEFTRVVLNAVAREPRLLNADRASLYTACLAAAHDGLVPDGREGALVAFHDKDKGQVVQWLPMIAGLRKKARQSGEIAGWEVYPVYERDEFQYELGDEPYIRHRPTFSDRGKLIAVYSVATMRDGYKSRDVMGVEEIDRVRKFSKSPNSPAWRDHYAAMALKTIARRHAKVLPMSTDLMATLQRDNALFGDVDSAVEPPSEAKPEDPLPRRRGRPPKLETALKSLAAGPKQPRPIDEPAPPDEDVEPLEEEDGEELPFPGDEPADDEARA
jgi:recombination protein RecT